MSSAVQKILKKKKRLHKYPQSVTRNINSKLTSFWHLQYFEGWYQEETVPLLSYLARKNWEMWGGKGRFLIINPASIKSSEFSLNVKYTWIEAHNLPAIQRRYFYVLGAIQMIFKIIRMATLKKAQEITCVLWDSSSKGAYLSWIRTGNMLREATDALLWYSVFQDFK